MSKHTFPDGSYNPMWPADSLTHAAILTIGGRGGLNAVQFDDIRLMHDSAGWVAEADDAGHTWRGMSDSNTGAILALLADRIGLRAEVTFKPEPEDVTE